MAADLKRLVACLLAVSVLASVGGALFAAVHGGTTTTRAIAYGFWLAAAVTLVAMAGAASKRLARRFDLPFIEGWLFVTASVLLTAIGVVVDLLGTY